MLIRPLSCVVDYVTGLNASLHRISSIPLTKSQRGWLVTVLMGLIVAGSFNWAAFARRSLGAFKESRLRWVFRHANRSWAHLLQVVEMRQAKHIDLCDRGSLSIKQKINQIILAFIKR